MNDALWECSDNFGEFWGIRLANLIRAFHILEFGNVDLDNIVRSNDDDSKTSDWFLKDDSDLD
jgi:hypothetical protein